MPRAFLFNISYVENILGCLGAAEISVIMMLRSHPRASSSAPGIEIVCILRFSFPFMGYGRCLLLCLAEGNTKFIAQLELEKDMRINIV